MQWISRPENGSSTHGVFVSPEGCSMTFLFLPLRSRFPAEWGLHRKLHAEDMAVPCVAQEFLSQEVETAFYDSSRFTRSGYRIWRADFRSAVFQFAANVCAGEVQFGATCALGTL